MFQSTDFQQTYTINQLLNGKLKIDFQSIVISRGQIQIEGCGYIFQDEKRELKLIFYRRELIDETKKLEYLIKRGNVDGGLIEQDCYVKAIDANGIKYSASCIFNPEIAQNIEEISIYQIKSTKIGEQNRVVFYGNYEIPTNSKYTTFSTYKPYIERFVLDERERIHSIDCTFDQRTCNKHDMWKITLSDDYELNLCQFDGYVDLLIQTNKNIDEETFERLLNTIDFILGDRLQILFYSIKSFGESYNSVDKMSYSKSTFSPPILRSDDPRYKDEYSRLFNSYFNYLNIADKDKYDSLIVSHRRIVAASRLYSFNCGQSLAIQIEYLVSIFFNEYKIDLLDDKQFNQDVQDIIDYLNKKKDYWHFGSKEWMVRRLKPGLSKEKLTYAKILKKLIQDHHFYGCYNSWDKLRNTSAHGATKIMSHIDLLKLIYDCVEIYYTMIYKIIGFDGLYSKPMIDNYASYEKYNLQIDK